MSHRNTIDNTITELLVRSETEVARLLSNVLDCGNPLTAVMEESGDFFIGSLRFVDADRKFILVEPGDNKTANMRLLGMSSVLLCGTTGNAFVEFTGSHPVDSFAQGRVNIRFEYPESMLLRQRRAHHRLRVLPRIPLDCIVGSDDRPTFVARIVDISHEGFGALISSAQADIRGGNVFRGCKIRLPDGEIIEMDLAIRHADKIVLPNGMPAVRAGFALHGARSEIDRLIGLFIVDMEQAEPNRD